MIFAALVFYVLTTLGLFILRVKRPEIPRPYKALGYPFLPALYIALAGGVMILILLSPKSRTEAVSGLVQDEGKRLGVENTIAFILDSQKNF